MSVDGEDTGFLSKPRIESGSWRALERAVARLFVHQGWPQVSLVGGPGDHGADVIASSPDRDILAQVKCKSNSDWAAGRRIVKDVKRAMEFYEIPEGFCVTNTRLSPTANDDLERLVGSGYTIKSLEGAQLYNLYQHLPRWPGNDFEPYEYQETPIQTLVDMYRDGQDRGLLSLATGLGKTFVTGEFLATLLGPNPETRVLVVADQTALIRQFEQALWHHLPKDVSTHLWYSNESPSYDGGIDIATFQTLENQLSPALAAQYDIVIVDEAHHAPAPTYQAVLNEFSPRFLLGLTATPWRENEVEVTMDELFGSPLEKLTIDVVEALRKGYLTEVDYRMYCDDIEWDFVQQQSAENYTVTDLNRKLFIQERDDQILDQFEEIWQTSDLGRSIVYCASIEHATRMETLLRERGYAARHLDSSLTNREVEHRLRAFRRGELEVLTAVDMLNEGVDVPEVDLIVFLRVTHSRRIFLQQLGRGLRLADGKNQVVVMDLVADIRRVAEAININRELERGDEIEVMNNNFHLSFRDQQSQSFFREYLADKAQIATESGEHKLRFP